MVDGGGLEQAAGKQAKGKHSPGVVAGVRGAHFHDQLKAVLLVMLLGAVSNLALLSGPWFLMLLYEEVLPSESGVLLLHLLALLVVVQASAAAIDWGRNRAMAQLGATLFLESIGQSLPARVSVHGDGKGRVDPGAVFASPVIVSFLDLPWTLLFLAVLAFFHPLLGLLAIAGVIAIFAIGLLARSEILRAKSLLEAIDRRIADMASQTDFDQNQEVNSPESGSERSRRHQLIWMYRERALARLGTGAGTSRFRAIVRPLRQFLQSAMLALGAWLVIEGELKPAAMFASSVLLGRMLAPIEQVAITWPDLLRGLKTWWVEGAQAKPQTPPCEDEGSATFPSSLADTSRQRASPAPGGPGSQSAEADTSSTSTHASSGRAGRKRDKAEADCLTCMWLPPSSLSLICPGSRQERRRAG